MQTHKTRVVAVVPSNGTKILTVDYVVCTHQIYSLSLPLNLSSPSLSTHFFITIFYLFH